MPRRRNICAPCLKGKRILSFTHMWEPVIATCFYCRNVNQDGFYIYDNDVRSKHFKPVTQEDMQDAIAQERKLKEEKSGQKQEA